nr:MAG TPA: hypothetical protein [Caudoviricetes sp.]DAP73342.1 MAG TPA: hypothetical protein [Caudoviricetes sp.]DAU32215.1 MAG TPA: hypothetical protein [Caudoviricetes sp.]
MQCERQRQQQQQQRQQQQWRVLRIACTADRVDVYRNQSTRVRSA